jgi:hypothetical protein
MGRSLLFEKYFEDRANGKFLTNKSFGLVVSDNIFKISASQKQEFPIGPVLKVLFEK